MTLKTKTIIDFHTHCLPAMDDGSPDADTSLAMLRLLKEQGMDTVLLTPHYRASAETVGSFLERRAAAFDLLRDADGLPRLLLGAEVALERELDETALRSLCLGDTDYLLLELPFLPFAPWMAEKAGDILYHGGCRPVFAHLPRYLPYVTAEDFDTLLSIPGAVAQVNTDEMLCFSSRRLVKRWLRAGVPVVFGSDCHNLDTRRPNFDKAGNRISRPVGRLCPAAAANALAEKMGLL